MDTAAEGLEPRGSVSIAKVRGQEGEPALCVRLSVDTVAYGRETRVLGKASHRGHRGHRGGWHYEQEALVLPGLGENTVLGKASQEATEGGLDWARALRGYRGFGRETHEKENIGNQRPIAIEELTKRKAARIKHRAVLVG